MLAFRMLVQSAFETLRKLLIDKTVLGATIVGTGTVFSLTGSGGRKITKLSNGWLVMAVYGNVANTITFYVSKDKGTTWSILTTNNWGSSSAWLAVASYGTMVYCTAHVGANTSQHFIKFDALTVGSTVAITNQIDINQTAFGYCSLAVAPDGTIHACWVSKNASLPTVFNIRYSKSIDGGNTWATPSQVNSYANTYNSTLPCIVIRADGTPIIFVQFVSSYYYIVPYWFNGTTWVTPASGYVYSGADRGQYDPCATVDANGIIRVVWTGYDATDSSKVNIRYSESSDNGATWSTMLKLTTGNVAGQSQPKIACDANGDIHVVWTGGISDDTNYAIRYIKRTSGVWGSIQNLTTAVNPIPEYPQLCDNHRDFTFPIMVWKAPTDIKFLGSYNEDPAINQQTNAVVVTSAYDTSGTGGRKLVRLSNSWLVSVVANGTTDYRFYGSKDNGATWSLVKTVTAGGYQAGFAITSVGTNIKFIRCGLTEVSTVLFDANIVAWDGGSLSYEVSAVDTGQTILGACSLEVAPNGDLHACWASKNASYPNSFNIRYSKSTNGGATWSAPTQVSTANSASIQNTNPCIVIKSDGNPILTCAYESGAGRSVESYRYNGTSWVYSQIYVVLNTLYYQDSICATVDATGIIHVVWQGYASSAPPIVGNLRYSKSTDNGATWSAMVQITNETTHAYSQYAPSITYDANNKLHIGFSGYSIAIGGAVLLKYATNKSGSWVVTNLTTQTSGVNADGVQVCDNFHDFDEALMFFKDTASANVKFRGKWNGEYTRFDRSRGVVVDSAYDISGNGGRKIVRLGNSWLVSSSASGGIVYFHVSKDSGTSWQQLCYTVSNVYTIYAITSIGTNVYCAVTRADGNAINFYAFNATTVTNAQLTNTGNVTTTENGMSGISITTHSDGSLHVAYSCKNATYPNSFNIKYSKSTNGGVSWDTPTQLTATNTAGYNHGNPCIVINALGNPVVVNHLTQASINRIYWSLWTGSVWNSGNQLYDGGSYTQSNPCATVDSNGVIHVVWTGLDATDSANNNIRYSKSTDNGLTWSVPVKLTTGNTLSQWDPTITCDLNNSVYVAWSGRTAISPTYRTCQSLICTNGVWGSYYQYPSEGVNIDAPQYCDNFRDFIEPLSLYMGSAVKVRGKWYEEVA